MVKGNNVKYPKIETFGSKFKSINIIYNEVTDEMLLQSVNEEKKKIKDDNKSENSDSDG